MSKALAFFLIALIFAPTGVILAETPEPSGSVVGCSQNAATSTENENTSETLPESNCGILAPNDGQLTVLENELTGTNAVATTTSYIHGDHLGGNNGDRHS
ncbi:TPA: hypothetical protein DIS55_01865 [Candidatus Kaiserbacteria bacterium]|uniref:Secreted protein n=1 Tax=Candidatus Kaiserbacteria bacterium RIFCSPLOWO2_12_FULL_50_28 TaxID=1798527 RepID=A0A1F6FNG0_9BACT|nr:MAG: hypothetical protein A3H15_02465 [Candidatus Kaiserbacteria bacterium RIFCSPLOWO2_12_FULL_50_28]HCM43676.1 hypothetical protein [Candidatus Kaiserbacteria bacterium]